MSVSVCVQPCLPWQGVGSPVPSASVAKQSHKASMPRVYPFLALFTRVERGGASSLNGMFVRRRGWCVAREDAVEGPTKGQKPS